MPSGSWSTCRSGVRGHWSGARAPGETVPPPSQGFDLVRAVRLLGENATDLTDAEVQAAIEIHHHIFAPDRPSQLIARDQVACAFHEEQQHASRLLLEPEHPLLAAKLEASAIDGVGAEREKWLHTGRPFEHGPSPIGLERGTRRSAAGWEGGRRLLRYSSSLEGPAGGRVDRRESATRTRHEAGVVTWTGHSQTPRVRDGSLGGRPLTGEGRGDGEAGSTPPARVARSGRSAAPTVGTPPPRSSPPPAARTASWLSVQHLPDRRVLEGQARAYPLQVCILRLELSQPHHLLHRCPRVSALPREIGVPADLVPSENLRHGDAGLAFLQDLDDLRLGEPRSSHYPARRIRPRASASTTHPEKSLYPPGSWICLLGVNDSY